MTDIIDRAVRAAGFDELSRDTEHDSIRRRVAPESDSFFDADTRGMRRMATVLELQALTNDNVDERVHIYGRAFVLWRAVLEAEGPSSNDNYQRALRLAMTGTLSGRVTETRQVLRLQISDADDLARTLESEREILSWRDQVLRDVRLSLILLVRKEAGWADISVSLGLLAGLRGRQDQFEGGYLGTADDDGAAALSLVGLYHVAQMVTLVGRYLETGDGVQDRIGVQLDRHMSRATQAFTAAGDTDSDVEAQVIHRALTELVGNSIWSQLQGLGQSFSEFAQQVTHRSTTPLLELWPSQRQALERNFFDAYRRALLVEMPTSAGKSLLAKLAIVQAHSLYPTATIAYIVPTRVLVNQVTDDLRADLGPLGIAVEQAVPVFELDPSEDMLLSDGANVIVTTAEKLDLLIRTNHVATRELSMVIVDEAHNLNDGTRGARLELVLATIQRDRPGARYVLLSPFLPNGQDLVRWLGSGRSLDPISVSWRPNKRVVGALEIRTEGRGRNYLELVTARALSQSNLPPDERLPLAFVGKKPSTLGQITRQAVAAFRNRPGVTLVVIYGRMRSAERAREIASDLPVTDGSPLREATRRFLDLELGPGNALSEVLRHRVAYHHAGMSLEARKLIEKLIRDGEIDVVCGTTTLAQGVNFPISDVIVESRTSGRGAKYSYSQFWNMAGRAGRGLHSDLGVVAYPVSTEDQRNDWRGFFEAEAEQVASQLAELVTAADTIGHAFTFDNLRNYPTLSSFLQYLAHAMNVSGASSAADDIEDLLRSSLLFQNVEDRGAGASRLIELCRRYLDSIQDRSGLVALADGTGFSTPAVGRMQGEVRERAADFTADSWEPSRLFGSDVDELTDRIALIASLPEIQLGPDDNEGPFNPERVARALRAWVGGASIAELGSEFGPSKSGSDEDRITAFASYLYGRLSTNASWGLGALERVSLAIQPGDVDGDDLARHVPSMVYFGVDSREAIWMRMAGLPRGSAKAAAYLWTSTGQGTPHSYGELRRWIDEIDVSGWQVGVTSTNSLGSAPDHRLIWRALTGRDDGTPA